MSDIIWHNHHIIPKHMGGTDSSDNLIRVNISMHAFLHKCLYEEYGNWQDEIAWKALSGQITNAEINNEIRKKRMIGNKIWKNRKHSDESKKKMGPAKGTKFTKEHKKKLSDARKKRITKQSTKEKLSKPRYNRRKKYQITYPDGQIEVVFGLKDFCIRNGLTESNLRKTITGDRQHHRNFKAKEMTE